MSGSAGETGIEGTRIYQNCGPGEEKPSGCRRNLARRDHRGRRADEKQRGTSAPCPNASKEIPETPGVRSSTRERDNASRNMRQEAATAGLIGSVHRGLRSFSLYPPPPLPPPLPHVDSLFHFATCSPPVLRASPRALLPLIFSWLMTLSSRNSPTPAHVVGQHLVPEHLEHKRCVLHRDLFRRIIVQRPVTWLRPRRRNIKVKPINSAHKATRARLNALWKPILLRRCSRPEIPSERDTLDEITTWTHDHHSWTYLVQLRHTCT